MTKKEIGAAGESLACEMLERRGYRILTRNYRCTFGEIDIIAIQGDKIAFVEVKTRLSDSYGDGRLAVDYRKRMHIKRAAGYFLAHSRVFYKEIDFQVIEIRLTHLENLEF